MPLNRTPVAGEIYATRDKRDIDIYGCGLAHTVAQAASVSVATTWETIRGATVFFILTLGSPTAPLVFFR